MTITILKKTSVFLLIGFLLSSFTDIQKQKISDIHVKLPHLSTDYSIRSVPFNQVHFTDAFWKPRIDRMFTVTLPHELAKLQSTGREKISEAGQIFLDV